MTWVVFICKLCDLKEAIKKEFRILFVGWSKWGEFDNFVTFEIIFVKFLLKVKNKLVKNLKKVICL